LAAPGALDEAGAFRFSIGPSINWGIFNLGQVRARIRTSDAASEAAAAQWQGSLLAALEEADGAIDAWRSARSAAASAERATATVRARARAGAASAPNPVIPQFTPDRLLLPERAIAETLRGIGAGPRSCS
jgi:outer membrane protein TolC